MAIISKDSFKTRTTLDVGGKKYEIFSLEVLAKQIPNVAKLPFSMKVLLESLLRNEDGITVTKEDIEALAKWSGGKGEEREISFYVARVLMQDFTGVPCVVDLASMREALKKMGGDPAKVNPLRPAELVIDHSVQVDKAGTLAA
ncbi:MAG TPA: aconitase family protein, partial [bacterium]|nr:aconitase family protein [bacterium]